MSGLLKVIDMLGNTVAQLEDELAKARDEIAWLQKALEDKPAPETLDAA